MAVPGDTADEGLGGFSPPHSGARLPPKPLPAAPGECQAVDSLACMLRTSLSPLARARLAVALLTQVPADVLKLALCELDGLLRRDFVGMLPAEIALRILAHLPAGDIARGAALVSRQWHAVAMQPWLWRRLFRGRGWALDKDRRALYAALPTTADVDRSLLRRAMQQAASAITAASAATLAPAVAAYSGVDVSRAQAAASADDGERWLLDGGAAAPSAGSLAAATAEAMAATGGGWWARAPAEQRVWAARQRQAQRTGFSPSPAPSPLACRWRSAQQQQQRRQGQLAVDWRGLYAENHQLLANWRTGRCRVDRWDAAHPESIYCLQLDQHNRLLTGSRDHTVRLWHVAEAGSQLTHLATLRGHRGSVLTLQAEGSTLVTGSSDATACVWDLRTFTVERQLQHADSVLSLRFNDRWLATACKDCLLRVWRRDRGYTDMFELTGHTVAVNAVHLHGDMLVSASGDRTIRVWDLTTRSCVLTLEEHARGVACLDFDGQHIVSGGSDRSIRIWNVQTGVCERTIPNAHGDLVRTVMFDRRMDVVVSGSYDETIKVWSFATGALLHKFKNLHSSRVYRLMFDRTRIVSCSHDRSVAIVDFGAGLAHARQLA
ncbi:hypothetical protein LPJ61_003418 [Coemansia biformis]|uniref:F-box domain-containing protein n=1 Tax=Coemansia biformis TaxID=1286918 RepID=A0A9W7Y6L3_9FUNG|nr:hypothetical protein LPJ61_003418 [Coemansia biformis]